MSDGSIPMLAARSRSISGESTGPTVEAQPDWTTSGRGRTRRMVRMLFIDQRSSSRSAARRAFESASSRLDGALALRDTVVESAAGSGTGAAGDGDPDEAG